MARARLNEGGLQSIPAPRLSPAARCIGDAAGFLNVPKIKGSHTAMKSGMLAAETRGRGARRRPPGRTHRLRAKLRGKLGLGRAVRACATSGPASPGRGLWGGLAYAGIDTYLLARPGALDASTTRTPTTSIADATPTQRRAIAYPKPDGMLTFDRLSSVFISNTNHEENQPAHLRLRDPALRDRGQLDALYAAPETRYCPAGVYEIVGAEAGEPRLQINAQNCVHCKTCDIKDPTQNIDWVTPEGGGGPNYPGGM